ncbi:histidinol-phosphate transaminase [Psychroserpens sp. XS_ASV72]|uniref:histidinol-phosphate transaminase n=1 Tax=Psychroserpens sp. XS_ASV72 TaxID=3241293 RepID=UPI0035136CD3
MITREFNIQSMVRDNIITLKPYASARDEFAGQSEHMVFMDANENPFNSIVNRYPDPKQTELRVRISQLKNVSPSQIILGNGSDELLDLLFRAFCNPGKDHVITLPPTYGMYEVLAQINDIEVVSIELDSDFEPQVSKILENQNESSKLLFLCSPNNPTANNFNTNTIETLILNFNGIVVIDEAYIDFSKRESWLNRLDEFPNLIVLQTFSKAYGMAGIRLGMCFASETVISILNSIKLPYNINVLTQMKALDRLSKTEIIQTEIKRIIEQREWLKIELDAIPWITIVYPSDTNFLLIKVDNANKRYTELISKGIVVRNRTSQPGCDNCLRITVGTAIENLKLIKTLKTIS